MYKDLKEIGKHFSIYGSGLLLRRLAGFLLIPVYTRFLTPADYGTASLVQVFFALLSSVVGLHLIDAMMRFYYSYDKDDRKKLVSTTYILSLGVGLIVLIAILLLSKKVSALLFDSYANSVIIVVAALTLGINIINSVSLACLRTEKESVKYTSISVVSLLVSLVATIYLIVILKKGVLGWFVGSLCGSFVTFGICFVRFIKGVVSKVSLKILKKMLVYSYPLIFAGLLGAVITNADKLLIKKYLDLSALGIYALAFTFGMVVKEVVAQPLMLVWGPHIYSNLEKPKFNLFISKFTLLFFVIMATIFLVASIYVKDIIMLVADKKFWFSSKLAPFAIFFFAVQTFLVVPSIVFQVTLKTKYIFWGRLLILATVVIANIWLLPIMGIFGAAWALVITAIVQFFFSMYFSKKVYPLYFNHKKMIIVSALAGIFLVLGLGANFSPVCTRTGFISLSFFISSIIGAIFTKFGLAPTILSIFIY